MPVDPINFAMVLGLAQRRRFQTELSYAWMEMFNARVENARETNMVHHSANHDKKKKYGLNIMENIVSLLYQIILLLYYQAHPLV